MSADEMESPFWSYLGDPHAQQICNGVVEAFKSFQGLLKLFRNGELNFYPKPPKYRKPGLFTLTYPNKWLKLTEEGIRCPKGRKVKAWDAFGGTFGVNLESFFIPIFINLNWEGIKEGRQRRLQRIRFAIASSPGIAAFMLNLSTGLNPSPQM